MAPQSYETMFYELMWQIWSRNAPYPMPWWLQSYFRDWPGDDGGMFGAKQTALASNALYRYWNMGCGGGGCATATPPVPGQSAARLPFVITCP